MLPLEMLVTRELSPLVSEIVCRDITCLFRAIIQEIFAILDDPSDH